MRSIFVTGTGTGVGKTVVSAVLAESLGADYWKPIQAGGLDSSDTMKVKSLVSNQGIVFHEEAYCLSQPMSPHAAAAIDGVEIKISKIVFPETDNTLIIEGAGGLMVPLNQHELMIDLIEKSEAETVLVVQNYLGSINHTLLSIEVLKSRNITVLGIIFNGKENKSSETFILAHSGICCLGRIPEEQVIDRFMVQRNAEKFRNL